MSEERVVGAVSADEVRGHVERITTTIPSRLAGSENGRRMAEYSAAALTEAGVAARVFEMPGLVSFPEPAEMRVVCAGRDRDRGEHARAQRADACRRALGRADRRRLRRLPRIRGQERGRQDHAFGAVIPSGPAREAAHLGAHGRDRVRDDELGAPGEHRGAVRLGEAGLGQSDARDLQDRDGDAALRRHRPHRRAQAARDAEGRPGARLVSRQCRERLAAGPDHHRRDRRADQRFRGRRRASGFLARPAGDRQRRRQCLRHGACTGVRAMPGQAQARARLRLLDRPRDRHDDRLVLVSSIATGTGCASMRSPICRSTSRLAPARAAGAPPRTSS